MKKVKKILLPMLVGFSVVIVMLGLVVAYVWATGGFEERYEPLTGMSFSQTTYLIDQPDTILLNPLPEDATELEVEIDVQNAGVITLPETYSIGSPIVVTPIQTAIQVPVFDTDGNPVIDESTGLQATEERQVNVGGVTTLLAYTKDWKFTAQCTIVVDAPVIYFELESNAPEHIYPGSEFDVYIDSDTLLPSNSLNPTASTGGFTKKEIVYESSNETIATVDKNGHVTVLPADGAGRGRGPFTIYAYVVAAYKSLDILPKESDYQDYEYEVYLQELNKYRVSNKLDFYSSEINVESISVDTDLYSEVNPLAVALNDSLTISPETVGLKVNPQLGSPYESSELTHYFRDITVKIGLLNNGIITENHEFVRIQSVPLQEYPYVNWVIIADNYKEAILGIEFELRLLRPNPEIGEDGQPIDQYDVLTAYVPIKITKVQVTSLEVLTPQGSDIFEFKLDASNADSAYWEAYNAKDPSASEVVLTSEISGATLNTSLEGNRVYNLYDYYSLLPNDADKRPTYTAVKFFTNSVAVGGQEPAPTPVIYTLDVEHNYNNFVLKEIAGLTLEYIKINDYRLKLTSGVLYPMSSGTVQIYALIVKTEANGDYKYQTTDGHILYKEGENYYYYLNGERNAYFGQKLYVFDYMSAGVNVQVSEYLKINSVDVKDGTADDAASVVNNGNANIFIGADRYVTFTYNIQEEFDSAFANDEITYEIDSAVVSVQEANNYFVLKAVREGQTTLLIKYKDETIYSVTLTVFTNSIAQLEISSDYEEINVQLSGNSYSWKCVDEENQSLVDYKIRASYAPSDVTNASIFLVAYADENCTVRADSYVTITYGNEQSVCTIVDGFLDATITPKVINKTLYFRAVSASNASVVSNALPLVVGGFEFTPGSIQYYYENTEDSIAPIVSGQEISLAMTNAEGGTGDGRIYAEYGEDSSIVSQANGLIKFRVAEESLEYANILTIDNDNCRMTASANVSTETLIKLEIYTDFGYVFAEKYNVLVMPGVEVDLGDYSSSSRIQMNVGSSITLIDGDDKICSEYLKVTNRNTGDYYLSSDIRSVSASITSAISYDDATGVLTAQDNGVLVATDVTVYILLEDGYQVEFYITVLPVVRFLISNAGKVVSIGGNEYELMFAHSSLEVASLVDVEGVNSFVIENKQFDYKVSFNASSDYSSQISRNGSTISVENDGTLIAHDIVDNFFFYVRVSVTVNYSATYVTLLSFRATTDKDFEVVLGYSAEYVGADSKTYQLVEIDNSTPYNETLSDKISFENTEGDPVVGMTKSYLFSELSLEVADDVELGKYSIETDAGVCKILYTYEVSGIPTTMVVASMNTATGEIEFNRLNLESNALLIKVVCNSQYNQRNYIVEYGIRLVVEN